MKEHGVSQAIGAVTAPIACSAWGPVPPPPSGWTWEGLMTAALAEAHSAEASGEIPVGALVVAPDGTLLGRGRNNSIRSSDPTAHAEIQALRAAGHSRKNYRLEQCILVVTLEPCLMCAGALVHARIGGLVYGAADTKAGAVHSCFNAFELPFLNHRVWHMGGILSQRCAEQLQRFFVSVR